MGALATPSVRRLFTASYTTFGYISEDPRDPLTDRQVYYLAQTGVLTPIANNSRCRGDTRLWSESDVALLRLYAWLLNQQGLPAWHARALLLYLGSDIRVAVDKKTDAWVVIDGARGAVVPLLRSAWIRKSVRSLHRGIPAAMRALKKQRTRPPIVWQQSHAPTAEATA